MRAALKFSICVDHDEVEGELKEVRIEIILFKEKKGWCWRLEGELGDECEELPSPKNIAQAKIDAFDAYFKTDIWKPKATWVKNGKISNNHPNR